MKINCWEKKDRLKKLFLCDPTWVGHSPQGMCHSVWNWDYYLASFSFGLFLFGSWYTALQHGYKDEKETVQRFELAILVCTKMDHYSGIKIVWCHVKLISSFLFILFYNNFGLLVAANINAQCSDKIHFWFGQWLWHSWLSSCFFHLMTQIQIKSSAIYFNIEETIIKKIRTGNGLFYNRRFDFHHFVSQVSHCRCHCLAWSFVCSKSSQEKELEHVCRTLKERERERKRERKRERERESLKIAWFTKIRSPDLHQARSTVWTCETSKLLLLYSLHSHPSTLSLSLQAVVYDRNGQTVSNGLNQQTIPVWDR